MTDCETDIYSAAWQGGKLERGIILEIRSDRYLHQLCEANQAWVAQQHDNMH